MKSFVYQDIDNVRKNDAATVTNEAAVRLTLTLGMLPPAAASNEDAFFTKLVGTEPSVHVVKAQRPHRDRS
jgi:hypothetical protein